MLVRWLVFIHVLSAITFFLSHGTSVAMVFKIRSETDFVRIRAMLDLSISTFKVGQFSFLGMAITGLTMPFLIHIWDKVWIWLSIIIMLFVFFYMFWFDERTYKILRKLVGGPSHTSAATASFLQSRYGAWLRVLPTPAHSSWLNQAEILLKSFEVRYLQRGNWTSRQHRIDHLYDSTPEYNRLWAQPINWSWTRRDLHNWAEKKSV